MAEFPALPLFTDAYLGDTTHLTTFEHGAYLLLLIVSWRSSGCCVPDDDKLLARYTRMTADKWRKVRPVLQPFFRIEDGLWHQARLQDELQHLQSRKLQQSEAGLASARAKSLKRKNRGSTTVGRPLQRKSNETSTPTPTPNSVDKSTAGKPASIEDDPVKQLFDAGVAYLTSTGMTEKQARSLIGKWRKEVKDDGKVLKGLLDCKAASIAEPVEWLQKRFNGSAYVSKSGYEYRGDIESVMKQAEKRSDWDTYWQCSVDLKKQRAH